MDKEKFTIKKLDESILLSFPAKKAGKFYWKERTNNKAFGIGLSMRKKKIDSTKTYLEWQIGFDFLKSDDKESIFKDKKLSFNNHKNKEKYPYEIAEIILFLLELNIINKKKLDELYKKIKKNSVYFIHQSVFPEKRNDLVVLNEIHFYNAYTQVPSYSYSLQDDDVSIEVITQKQQYASGYQPMVYFCVPMMKFENPINERKSKKGDLLLYRIQEKNYEVFLRTFEILAMVSQDYQSDLLQIIKKIQSYFSKTKHKIKLFKKEE